MFYIVKGGIFVALSNGDKNKHGLSAQDNLKMLLEHCKTIRYIKSFTYDFKIGKPGYENTTQFYAPFVIEFYDNIKWALFSTTSMRTDRIKGQQWDAMNLKNVVENMTHAYLVYPDGLDAKDEKEFIRQNNKYQSGFDYSFIDAIVSQNTLYHMIENHALSDETVGKSKDLKGNNFERLIAYTLQATNNIIKWKHNFATDEGLHYNVFETIVNALGLIPEQVSTIEATSEKSVIGRLPSGGNPKTDVLVTVTFVDETVNYYTISCKRSSEKSVSVHEYTASTFADVLDSQNGELRALLMGFQKSGSMTDFGEDNCSRLTNVLQPYIEKLTRWVISGEGGIGTSPIQCAQYIITYDDVDETFVIHTTKDYCRKLINNVSGAFGTPFAWTYPSKRRGQRIQLKTKILK